MVDFNKSYQEFFKEDLYGGFVQHLLDRYGASKVIFLLKGRPLMGKRGVDYNFTKEFRTFLTANPMIEKRFAKENYRMIGMRNVAGGELAFPIDPSNEELMIRENIRVNKVIPVNLDNVSRASKGAKRSAEPMKGQIVRGSSNSRNYLHPKRLTIHFKEGFARAIGKTTLTYMVESREHAMQIILDRYENKVAYANIQNEEDHVFVKPRNGKIKRSRKLRSQV